MLKSLTPFRGAATFCNMYCRNYIKVINCSGNKPANKVEASAIDLALCRAPIRKELNNE